MIDGRRISSSCCTGSAVQLRVPVQTQNRQDYGIFLLWPWTPFIDIEDGVVYDRLRSWK
jgi:hypothetical protein